VKPKRITILFLSLIMLLTSGCWDKVEIEQRAIISAMSIDTIPNRVQENKNTAFCEEKPKRLKVTFGMINPTKINEGDKAFMSRTAEGVNLVDAMERFGSMTSRVPFYGHTRLLLLTENLLKDGKLFKEIIDQFDREAIVNRQMKVAMIERDIDTVLKTESALEGTISGYITGIMDNSRFLSYTLKMDLNTLITTLRNNDGSAVIPVVEPVMEEKQWVKIDKLALIKDYKFLDVLDTKYVKSYKMLNNELQSGRKLVYYKGIIVPFYIYSSSRRIWLEEAGDKLKYKVNVKLEGDIEQYEFNEEIFDHQKILEIEKATERSITEELRETTKYFQNVIGHDYLGFGDYTRKYHNKIFKEYENNWDEYFKNAEIDYDVKVDIRRVGNTKK
jgi:Ger(x)C family germination protein